MPLSEYIEYMTAMTAQQSRNSSSSSSNDNADGSSSSNDIADGSGGGGGTGSEALTPKQDSFPEYVFQHLKVVPATSSLHSIIEIPDLLNQDNIYDISPEIYMGSAGTSAPVHFHVNAVNVLPYGRKRWTVLPAKDALHTKEHIKLWHQRKSKGAVKCISRCGSSPCFGQLIYTHAPWGCIVRADEQPRLN